MGGNVNRAGAQEERDLGHGVIRHMRDATDDPARRQERGAHDDVGELADRREGQAGLQIVLPESQE